MLLPYTEVPLLVGNKCISVTEGKRRHVVEGCGHSCGGVLYGYPAGKRTGGVMTAIREYQALRSGVACRGDVAGAWLAVRSGDRS